MLRKMKNFKRAGSAGKVRSPSIQKEIATSKQTLNSPGASSDKPLVVDKSGIAVGVSPPLQQGGKKPRTNSPARDQSGVNAEDEARMIQAEADAQMRELGVLPFMNDLAACKRVGNGGLDLFRQAYSKYPAQPARVLQGKINSIKSETRRFAGRVETVQAELDTQCADRYTHLSSKNRELKGKAEQLQSIQTELAKVNKEIADKNKLL